MKRVRRHTTVAFEDRRLDGALQLIRDGRRDEAGSAYPSTFGDARVAGPARGEQVVCLAPGRVDDYGAS
jgi:hypothetical protein